MGRDARFQDHEFHLPAHPCVISVIPSQALRFHPEPRPVRRRDGCKEPWSDPCPSPGGSDREFLNGCRGHRRMRGSVGRSPSSNRVSAKSGTRRPTCSPGQCNPTDLGSTEFRTLKDRWANTHRVPDTGPDSRGQKTDGTHSTIWSDLRLSKRPAQPTSVRDMTTDMEQDMGNAPDSVPRWARTLPEV